MDKLLLLTILLPLLGAVAMWPLAALGRNAVRWGALLFTLATLGLAVGLIVAFLRNPPATDQLFAATDRAWLGRQLLDVRLAVGLDAISLWLFGLSALLMFTSVLVSWEAIDRQEPLFYSMLLLLEAGCLGVFTAQDIILFYVFFEFTLIPLFFLIGVWGSEQRRYAAIKFFLFTLAGSLLTFLGLLTIVFWEGGYIGVAGAWNDAKAVRPSPSEPLSLKFRIPSLTYRLKKQYEQMMFVADLNRDGEINAQEAANIQPHRVARAKRTFIDAVFWKYDTDGDGRLSRDELRAGSSDAEGAGLDELYLQAFFQHHDRDDNARLEVDELTTLRDATVAPEDAAEQPWGLTLQELADVGARKVSSITRWSVQPGDLAELSPRELDQLGRWSFTPADARAMDVPLQIWIFLALFVGFAVKVPLFPLHTWLPLAHVQAPAAGSVFLAAILLKIGTYGFLRFNIPMLPEATAAAVPWLLWLSVAGIIYGALVALAQSDMKKLIAYSSVSHLGFCMLGLFALNALGTQGAVLQMVNHGISTGALFALVGMLYERYHTRAISDYGGIARRLPVLAFFMLLFTMSSIGLPGLNGFAGEFLILLGMFQRAWTDPPLHTALQMKVISVVAVAGVVLGAWYMLWLVQRVFFGPLREPAVHHDQHGEGAAAEQEHHPGPIRDLSLREVAALAPLAVLVVWIGVCPGFFLQPLEYPLRYATSDAAAAIETERTQLSHQPHQSLEAINRVADHRADANRPDGYRGKEAGDGF